MHYTHHPRLHNRELVDVHRIRVHRLGPVNAKLAVWVTRAVGSMYCAWLFVAIALVSLPAAIRTGDPVVMVQWLSSVFLQLVLLSIIIVGQRIEGVVADQRASDTYKDAEAILHEALQIQQHLLEQDKILERLELLSKQP